MYICFNTILTGFNMRITESHLRRIIREELMLELAPSSGRSFDMKGGPSVKGADDMVSVARSAIEKLKNDSTAMQAIEDYFEENPDIAQKIADAAREAGVLREAKGPSIEDTVFGGAASVGGVAGVLYGAAHSPSPAVTKLVVGVLKNTGVTEQLYAHMQQLTSAGLGNMAIGAGAGAALGLVLGFLGFVAYDVIKSMRSSTQR